MKRLLLDTTFLIDQERGDLAQSLIDDEDDVAMSAITAAELLVGVELATGKTRKARQAAVVETLDAIPILSYDLRVARTHAELLGAVRKVGRPRGAHDLIIAATAKAHDRTIVTADEAGFGGLPGVEILSHR